MIPEKLLEIMKQDGIVAIATLGKDGPHMVNTWNSYIKISADERLFIPAGYMHKTEANIAHNPNVLITLGSSKVKGLHGAGAGFSKATFITSGPDYDFMSKVQLAASHLGRHHRFRYTNLVKASRQFALCSFVESPHPSLFQMGAFLIQEDLSGLSGLFGLFLRFLLVPLTLAPGPFQV